MAVFAGDAVRKRGALLRILIGHRVFSDDAARVAHAQNAAQLIDKAALHARNAIFTENLNEIGGDVHAVSPGRGEIGGVQAVAGQRLTAPRAMVHADDSRAR